MLRFPRFAICTCLLLCAPAPLLAQDQPKGEEEKKKEEGADGERRRGGFGGGGFGQGRYGGDGSGQVVEFLKGELDLDGFISHRITLDQVNHGFELMEAQDGIRSVICW